MYGYRKKVEKVEEKCWKGTKKSMIGKEFTFGDY